MRTSKAFRDAERISNALSHTSGNARPTRRSLRQFNGIAETDSPTVIAKSTGTAMKTKEQKTEDASSELSSLESSPSASVAESEYTQDSEEEAADEDEADGGYEEEDEDAAAKLTSASRKRKRASAGGGAAIKTEDESTRPRKKPARKTTTTTNTASAAPKKARRQPAKHIKAEGISTTPPENWEEVWDITAEMRKRILAPVDTMGCESLAEEHRSPLDKRLQTLIALMLSSQTKDTVTAIAMRTLQENLPGGFNLAALLAVKPDLLNQLIAKVGFHNNKTKYIKATALKLRDEFNGDIPSTIEGLVSLPGVGPKMAYLTMSAAWGRDEGIGVDVHVHRITNLWGWHKTKNPEETRAALEAWLPRERWHSINHLLVGFGQTVCLPVGRRCGECGLSGGLCPSAVIKTEVRKRVKKEVVKKETEGEEEGVGEDRVGVKVEEVEEDEVVVREVKAEEDAPLLDVPLPGAGTVPDMEDLGRSSRRSSGRKAAV